MGTLSAALNADTEGAFEEMAPTAPGDHIEIMGVRYMVRFDA